MPFKFSQFLFSNTERAFEIYENLHHSKYSHYTYGIASTVTVCIASFEAIGELQRKTLHQSRAAVFSWNACTIPASEELSTFVAPSSSSTRSVVSDRHLLDGISRHTLRKISKFPEILGELSMRKQCVPGSFFSTHALY